MFNKLMNRLIFFGSSMVSFGVGASFFTFQVDGGERALMFDAITGKGVREKVYGEGIHFKIPKLYEPIIYSVRLNPIEITSKTAARDLQNIDITVRILEKPDEKNLKRLYLDQERNYAKKVLTNITHEIIKTVVARYNPDELITQRENVSMEIRQMLMNRAKEFYIIVGDVAVTHIDFSHEYRQAIEIKQVSQQMAEREKFIVLKSEQEKRITVINAEAQSESAKLINQAMNDYGSAFMELKKLEYALAIVENVCKSPNVTFIPSGGDSKGMNFLYQI